MPLEKRNPVGTYIVQELVRPFKHIRKIPVFRLLEQFKSGSKCEVTNKIKTKVSYPFRKVLWRSPSVLLNILTHLLQEYDHVPVNKIFLVPQGTFGKCR